MALDIWRRHYLPDILTHAELDHLWQRGYSPEVLREQMRLGSRFFWIEQCGRNVGFVAYKPEPDKDRLWLTKLYVLPEYHGLGLGMYALDAVRQAARNHGLGEIRLYVFRRNERAIRAYRRAGFEILCEDRSDAGGGFFYDDYIMVARLVSDGDGQASC
jgi:ribosomal protein S18 acetylase RimI-like enzyme